MDRLPPLNQLSVNQKDELILFLREENQLLKAHIVKLEEKVLHLKAQVADLTNRLNQNSRNSHQPPSKNSFRKSKTLRPKSDKSSGGQKGHAGRTLEMTDQPNKQIKHLINRCANCTFNLEEVDYLDWKRVQVFDIAPLKIEVEEHLIEEKICPHCQKICRAQLPKGLKYGAQYGHRILGLSTYLHNYHYVASKRVVEFFQDVFNHSLSEGTIFNAEQTCFTHLHDFEKCFKKLFCGSC